MMVAYQYRLISLGTYEKAKYHGSISTKLDHMHAFILASVSRY